MADVQQADTIDPEYILLDGGGQGLLPIALCVHRGFLSLAATTGTDTKSLRTSFDLPTNVCWQLRTFRYSIEDTVDYSAGRFELYYAPTGIDFGASTQLNFPLAKTGAFGGTNGAIDNLFSIAASEVIPASNNATWSNKLGYEQGPFGLVSFQDESGGANPTVAIYSTNAPTEVGVARFCLTWLGYTYEQMRSSALWAGHHNRD